MTAEARVVSGCGCGGTYAGYQSHKRHGTPPCRESRDAYAAYIRDYRANRGYTRSTAVPLTLLRELIPHLPDHLAERVQELLPDLDPRNASGGVRHRT